jgi:hypothetical protein
LTVRERICGGTGVEIPTLPQSAREGWRTL